MAIIRQRPALTPVEEGPIPSPTQLSRAHLSRLRWYFQHAANHLGAAAMPDGVDLDLSVQGLIQRIHLPALSMVHYAITPMGEKVLGALREQAKTQRAPHHALGSHLAQWLASQTPQRLAWENCTFDVVVAGQKQTTRPDVFSMLPTLVGARATPIVHEVKVSRSDFLVDIKDPSKRAAYFALAPRVFYATPFGLVSPEEVPPECGLLEQDKQGKKWVVKKPAPRFKAWPGLNERLLLTLLLRTHPTCRDQPDLS